MMRNRTSLYSPGQKVIVPSKTQYVVSKSGNNYKKVYVNVIGEVYMFMPNAGENLVTCGGYKEQYADDQITPYTGSLPVGTKLHPITGAVI